MVRLEERGAKLIIEQRRRGLRLAMVGVAVTGLGCAALMMASGGPPVMALGGVLGVAVALLGMAAFLIEVHTVIDRGAGTIAVRGARWPRRRWAVTRPLTELAEIRSAPRGRGRRIPAIEARFTDGSAALLLAPVDMTPATYAAQLATIRRQAGVA
ncbi:MAG: hypothetical protein K8W52_28725 [Deltaproteobacteria bacterium]|nr:hypothetical protein [Deltaproteobacteria bacterium]